MGFSFLSSLSPLQYTTLVRCHTNDLKALCLSTPSLVSRTFVDIRRTLYLICTTWKYTQAEPSQIRVTIGIVIENTHLRSPDVFQLRQIPQRQRPPLTLSRGCAILPLPSQAPFQPAPWLLYLPPTNLFYPLPTLFCCYVHSSVPNVYISLSDTSGFQKMPLEDDQDQAPTWYWEATFLPSNSDPQPARRFVHPLRKGLPDVYLLLHPHPLRRFQLNPAESNQTPSRTPKDYVIAIHKTPDFMENWRKAGEEAKSPKDSMDFNLQQGVPLSLPFLLRRCLICIHAGWIPAEEGDMIWTRDMDGSKDPSNDAIRMYFISAYVRIVEHCV